MRDLNYARLELCAFDNSCICQLLGNEIVGNDYFVLSLIVNFFLQIPVLFYTTLKMIVL